MRYSGTSGRTKDKNPLLGRIVKFSAEAMQGDHVGSLHEQ